MRFLTLAVLLLPAAAGCSKSPTEPSDTPNPGVLQGQTVIATDGSPAPNLTIRVGERQFTSDGNGAFQIDLGGSGSFRAVVRGSAVVERETRVSASGSGPMLLSLIPSSFDMVAFDEMFRGLNSRLQRWT